MNLPKYEIEANSNYTVFKFLSEGPKGQIFLTMTDEGTANLALCDINPETGKLDDLSRSDNADMEKVLATVAACIYKFIIEHPDISILIRGNSDSRNRLYRQAINKYIFLIEQDFAVYGYNDNQKEVFEKNTSINYKSFLIEPKKL